VRELRPRAHVDLRGNRLAVRCYGGCDEAATLAGIDRAAVLGELLADSARDSGRHARARHDRPETPALRAVETNPVSTYARERVEWLIHGRVPRRAVTVLVGDPGLGKSLLTCRWAGETWRTGGAVLLATAEDSIAATVRPRLEAVEADLERVHIVRLMHEGMEEGIALPDDVALLEERVADTEAQLVVIDPLMAHLPENVNSWRDQSVRRALAPLHHMAEAQDCAVVVVGHLNKLSGTDTLYRIGGSIGIGGAARSVLLLARDPDDPEGEQGRRRVLAHAKCNVGEKAASLLYSVEPTLLTGDEQLKTARLVEHGEMETTAAQLLSRRDDDEAPARMEAEEFLRLILEGGPVRSQEVLRQAKDAGIKEKTLRRAKTTLGVKAVQVGGKAHGGWAWELPGSDGLLTAEGGHLTAAEPNSHISEDGHLTGEGDHLRVRWSDGHAREITGHLTDESPRRAPPRVGQAWIYPAAPDRRLRVLEVRGDHAKVRVEAQGGDAGKLSEVPLAAFGDGLRRVA
jgi:putative DNA primase/helicase